MYAFTYWHAYFDSAFLSHPLEISEALCQDLEITAAHLQRWPLLEQLPQLPKLFQLLERFILDEGNWTSSMCSEGELDGIQIQLNQILLYLQCEKRYGTQFWLKSSRRIQASIVHLSIFLRKFILAIIPEDCRYVLQAQRLDKMITDISKLENLVNLILNLIKPIHFFLLRKDFQEETQLSKQFLEQFYNLIQTLPKMKRPALGKIPKLMEFICIMNPIETELYEDMPHVGKKNATTFEKPKVQKKYSLEKNYNENSKKYKVVNNSIIKIKDKKSSLEKISFGSPKKLKDFIQKFQIFKFKDNIRKNSIHNKVKNKTVARRQTQEKTSSIDKDRSPSSHDRSLSIKNNPTSKMKSRTITNDIGMKEASFTVEGRSRQMTAKSILSQKSKSIRKPQDFLGEEVQHQRQQKTKKKKVVKLPIKTVRYSQQENLTDGKQKGWAIIREYLQKKIAERKLKNLILE